MKSSLWQQAKAIFDEARNVPESELETFLDKRCSNDIELRAEVEKLLGSYDSYFLENNALGAVEALIKPALVPGQVVGRYHIRELIGSGGMGQVYLAEDAELDRPVAFKVLHHNVAEDQERVRRFIQEARAASALNHPNILTIHEIGTLENLRYIVSEYIDGETLREKMRSGLKVDDCVDITRQVTTALKAAHSAGIIHRDIKPENIMIRRDGLVKVLDFGLAKLTGADDRPIEPGHSATSRIQTSPGLVMGTVAYMSPEQARGQSVDHRTDLWSVGVVLYEMLAGGPPFDGENVTQLLSTILAADRTQPANTGIPLEIRPICERALSYERNFRYQSAHDLLIDLEGEKKRMEYANDSRQYVTVASTDERRTRIIGPRSTLSAEYILSTVKRHKYATIFAVLIVMAISIGVSVYQYNGATPPDPKPALALIDSSTTENDLKFFRLPVTGQARDITISPDGRLVAYKIGDIAYTMQLDSSIQKEIFRDRNSWNLRFSPDSRSIYYSFGGANVTNGFKKVPINGGPTVTVIDDPTEGINEGMSFSPDGTTMVYTRELPGGGGAIMLAGLDGTSVRPVGSFPNNPIVGIPVFSPDGKTIACSMRFTENGVNFYRMVGVNVADGKQHIISDQKWNNFFGAVWLRNGNIVLAANMNISEPSQLWSVSATGEVKAITSGLISYRGLNATKTGDVIATHQYSNARDLWMLPNNDSNKAIQLTTSGEFQGKFSLLNDGRILTSSEIGGTRDIWLLNADGAGRKQLTRNQGSNMQPEISFDGKYIAFISDRTGGINHVYLMDTNGNNVKQLTKGENDLYPVFSSDGKWVFYVDAKDDSWKSIRRVSTDGGESSIVVSAPEGWHLLGIEANRLDGRLMYGLEKCLDKCQHKIGIVPPSGGVPKMIDVPANFIANRPHWTPDGRRVAVQSIDGGVGRLIDVWSISVDGAGKPEQITDFKSPGTNYFTWSSDGKQMLVSRGMFKLEPVLIRRSGD